MLILRTTRTAQPAQPSGVDWSNPLSRGLIVAISGAKPYELVNGVALRSEGGPTMVGAPPDMAGPRFNGSSGVLWAPIPRIALGNWTLLQVVRGNSPGTDRRSFNVGNSTTTTVLVAIGTGAANAAKVRAVGVNDFGTAPADTGQVSSADAFVSTGPRVVGLRYNRESGYQCFVNGAPDGFSAFVEPSSTYTVDRVGVGALYRTGAAAFFAGDSFGAFAWARALSNEEVAEASRNPWQLFAPEPRRIWVPLAGGGGAVDLVTQDATHGHSADSLVLTTSSTLVIADATHGHAADALALTTQSALSVADALHAHAADNIALTGSGVAALTIANALHSHTVDGLTLSTESVLALQDALHAHAADGISLDTGTSLQIAESLHVHTADGIALTMDAFLVVADATHGHLVDALVLTLPGAGADPAAVWSYVLSNGKTAEQNLVENNAMLTIVTAILRNKRITDPVAGTQTIFADDGVSVLLHGGLFEDAAGTQPYRGQGADRAERLA